MNLGVGSKSDGVENEPKAYCVESALSSTGKAQPASQSSHIISQELLSHLLG